MANEPHLYSFRRCPYAMRARMALVLSGQSVRVREILLKDKPDDMLAASPKGSVPVLVLQTGEVIDESLDVLRWAFAQRDPLDLWSDDTRREEALALITRNDGPFKHHLDRYKYATRYEGADAEEHRRAGAEILADLNTRLSDGGQLMGARPHGGDIALFPFVRQFRIADMDWFDAQDWPHLHQWLSGWMHSGLFTHIMKKLPIWKETREEPLLSSNMANLAALMPDSVAHGR